MSPPPLDRPPRLRRGDRVALCAASSPAGEAAVARGRALLEARYEVIDTGGVIPGDASDARRLAALEASLAGEGVRAVFATRGGYGLLRVAGRIPDGPPRLVVGFSDVTVLHAVLAHRGRASVHGPVVTQLPGLPAEDREALFALLEDPAPPPPLTGLTAIAPGAATGTLIGGNLACFAHLLGTPWFPELEGAVLLLEDVNEPPYKIDRMLTQLRHSGALGRCAAIALGTFSGDDDPAGTLRERLSDLGIPVVAGLPVGHAARNRAVPFGARVTVDAGAGVMRFLDGAVS